MLLKPIFNFSKEVPEKIRNILISEFVALRNIAVDLVNPHFEQWNKEYEEEVYGDDDSAYNAYIVSKQRPILEAVNKSCVSMFVRLDCDEYADIIGVAKFDDEITVNLTLIPVKEEL